MREIWKILLTLIIVVSLIIIIMKFMKPSPKPLDEKSQGVKNEEMVLISGINYIEMKKSDLLYKISAEKGNFSFDRGEGELEKIDGEIYLKDGRIIKLQGKSGRIVEKGEKIILRDSVRGTMDDETELSSEEMYYIAKDHFIAADSPVSLKNRFGDIKASSMFVNLRDDVIRFSGEVDAVIKRFKR